MEVNCVLPISAPVHQVNNRNVFQTSNKSLKHVGLKANSKLYLKVF